jgi:hypothetical protein
MLIPGAAMVVMWGSRDSAWQRVHGHFCDGATSGSSDSPRRDGCLRWLWISVVASRSSYRNVAIPHGVACACHARGFAVASRSSTVKVVIRGDARPSRRGVLVVHEVFRWHQVCRLGGSCFRVVRRPLRVPVDFWCDHGRDSARREGCLWCLLFSDDVVAAAISESRGSAWRDSCLWVPRISGTSLVVLWKVMVPRGAMGVCRG